MGLNQRLVTKQSNNNPLNSERDDGSHVMFCKFCNSKKHWTRFCTLQNIQCHDCFEYGHMRGNRYCTGRKSLPRINNDSKKYGKSNGTGKHSASRNKVNVRMLYGY